MNVHVDTGRMHVNGSYRSRDHHRRSGIHIGRTPVYVYHPRYNYRYHNYYTPSYLRHRYYYRPYRYHYVYINGYWYPQRYLVSVTVPPVTVVDLHQSDDTVVIQQSDTQASRQMELIEQLMRDNQDNRRRAARDLAELPGPASTAALVDALINDAGFEVRREAARALEELADPMAYEVLYRSATMDINEEVQDAAEDAMDAIAKHYDRSTLLLSPQTPPMNTGLAELAEYLEDLRFGDDKTRKKAADKLDDYPGTQTVAALINVLINDYDDEVREEAAHSLGKLGDRAALGFLRTAQYDDPEDDVRKEAEKAIEKIYNTIQ
ncbi:MAG: HEAT repeat domain-containing protein [Sedimentisphaerales bacterium]|nr:HEAT repeat domain-containing protein [Sedimentisphaerales bacterium]